MIITEIHVDDFGAWHDLTLAELSRSVTVFYGPNEAGKTTLLNLIRTALYGFSEKRCKRYLPPAHGNEAGGALGIVELNGEFRVGRSAPSQYRGGEGSLSIVSSDGQRHGNEFLSTMLNGVDETIFNNVFAVGLSQIQHLATLSDTEAANQLYGLATGVDRVSLFDVTQALEAERETLLPTESRVPGLFQELLDQRISLQKELKALRRDEGHFAQVRSTYRNLQQGIRQKDRAQRQLIGETDWDKLGRQVTEQWKRAAKLHDQLTALGPVVDVPPAIQKRAAQMQRQIKQYRSQWEQHRDQRRQLNAKAKKLKGRDTLYAHAAEIQALGRQRERIAPWQDEIAQAELTVEQLQGELNTELQKLGLHTGVTASQLPPISDQVIEALREPARESRELRQSVETLKERAEQQRRQAKRWKDQLDSASVRFGGESVGAVAANSRHLIEQLQQRLDIEESCEELVRRMDHVEQEFKHWQVRRVLPWRGVLTIGGIFAVGAMLLLAGYFNSLNFGKPGPLMLIGASLSVLSLVVKGSLEGSARESALQCQDQLDALLEQHQTERETAAELDESLPPSDGTLDQRLIDARQRLQETAEFLPLQERYDAAVRDAELTDQQATLAVRRLKDSRQGWKASLRTVGLPESLTPQQIGEMKSSVAGITQLRTRLAHTQQLAEQHQQELQQLQQRASQLLAVAGIHDLPENVGAQLTRLTTELAKHTKSGKQRAELKQRWLDQGAQQRRIANAATELIASRRQLLTAHGIRSERELKGSRARSERAKKLRQQRDKLLHGISQQLGEDFTASRLRGLLERRSTAVLDHLARLAGERQALADELSQMNEQAELLKMRLDTHANDRRAEQKEMAILAIDERLRQTARRWQQAALMTSALDTIRRNYETKRQPVALAEASRHFERLTEGRYTRIWTPMGQNALCVDNQQGQVLPVEKLSRGTRELVFLALRLALVSSYRRRGANMPIVLDDVFVNFDDKRARAVAGVLADIAEAGQQLLIFTCHQRIRSIFAELQADVRDLPRRSQSAQRVLPSPTPLGADIAHVEEPEPVKPKPKRKSKPKTSRSKSNKSDRQAKPKSAQDMPVLPVIEPPPTVPPPPVMPPNAVDAPLPVYDATDWDAAVQRLAMPMPTPEPPASRVQKPADADPPWDEPLEPLQPMADQFQPAWRDEWLEPLPDLD